ncbi:MAG: hypothetical protein JO292_08385 [Betaproteobacteria bacterium]|nr:hypothetical protein [Betaproteobacteria bacterium]MBV9361396.1 hypothetical protein [Betaproteobacteria bacterium]
MRLLLAWLLVAGTASAQERTFNDPFIDRLAGEWTLTRQIRGKEVENAVRAEWVLNHQFLQVHMIDSVQPPAYEALIYIGYQQDTQRYVVHWLDVYGGKGSAIGYGKRSGDSIEVAFQYDDGPFYNTLTWDTLGQGWTFKMESVDKEGKRKLFAIDTLRKK